MKKILKYMNLFVTVITAMTVASCAMELAEADSNKTDSGLVELRLTANAAEDTKVEFDATDYPALRWREGDQISVIGETSGYNSAFTAQESGLVSEIRGSVQETDNSFYAVYPYNDGISIAGPEAKLLNVSIPTVQYATAAGFDPAAYVASAKFNKGDETISFRTECAFLKFRLYNAAKIKSVRIEAHQDKGTANLSGALDNSQEDGCKTYVELIEKEDGHQFSSGTDYFLVTRECICPAGITVTVTYDNEQTFTRSTDKQIFPDSGARNCIMDLGILNDDGTLLNPVLDEVVDFSYAGYNHGETAPVDVYTLGYRVYDVTSYGAVPNDGMSDRAAFLAALDAALGTYGKTVDGNGWLTYAHTEKANAIIYFPEGEYILHTSDDDDKVNKRSQSIVIRAGNFIIKGAGRDLTTLVMKDPMLPANEHELYSSPQMIQLKHNSGLNAFTVVKGEKSAKGSFSVEVSNVSGLAVGDWVCLSIKNDNENFIAAEIAPYTAPSTWNITKEGKGVEIYEHHQIKAIQGNVLIFHEPLMHEVDPNDDWLINTFPHYENVGVEDLTFKGDAVDNFYHHLNWNHDGGYKPLSMNRLTNSWIRRVDFVSTSEACTVLNSANVSVYDIEMSGNRGHSAIRSQAASRVLIAATKDISSENAGNFHGVGVSKQSIGTVLWRNIWGDDSCFESHANQPRATLIDCCSGGWMKGRMGGNYNEAPHHLADLTIWNFYATTGSGNFTWWDTSSWNFLPPVIVGFRSANSITFSQDQVRFDELHGEVPPIESLYEEQLRNRLGYLPIWLNELKTLMNK